MKSIVLPNIEATNKLGLLLAQSIEHSALIALEGQLGTGKTTMVKALATGLGVKEIVASPTFVIMNEYLSGRIPLYHLDFYRFGDGSAQAHDQKLLAVQVEELCQLPGVVVIEWPQYFKREDSDSQFLSGRDHLKIQLEYGEKSELMRVARVEECGPSSTRLANNLFNLAKDMFIYS